MKKRNAVEDLLAAINRQPAKLVPKKADEGLPTNAVSRKVEFAKPNLVAEPLESNKKPKGRVGRPVQFWMHDADRKLLRELSAWLAGQGLRPSDSMVIRAALRQAKTGSALIEAYWEAAKLDGRLKRD